MGSSPRRAAFLSAHSRSISSGHRGDFKASLRAFRSSAKVRGRPFGLASMAPMIPQKRGKGKLLSPIPADAPCARPIWSLKGGGRPAEGGLVAHKRRRPERLRENGPMTETIKRILEAANGENPETSVSIIVDHALKAAQDQAAGVEDVTAGLKSTLAKKAAALEEAERVAREQKAELDRIARERESEEHGVDDAAVQKLAEERAAKMAENAVQAAKEEAARERTLREAAEGDVSHLVGRLETAYRDHELYRNGGDKVDPLFFPLLRDRSAEHMKIDGEADGEAAWWRSKSADPPAWAVVDPVDGKTRLTGKEGPMTPAELISQKQTGDWAAFWPRTDSGPGGETHRANGDSPADLSKMTGAQILETQVMGNQT